MGRFDIDPSAMSLLSLRNVSKSYAGVPALRSVSLSIEPGEVHALMGENGAGKSTLIKILAGVVPADKAEIAIDGRRIAIDSPNAAFDHGLRFIHQELNVVPALSVAENIFLGRPYPQRFGRLVDWDRLAAAAREALARLGVSHIDPRQQDGAAWRRRPDAGLHLRRFPRPAAAPLPGSTSWTSRPRR